MLKQTPTFEPNETEDLKAQEKVIENPSLARRLLFSFILAIYIIMGFLLYVALPTYFFSGFMDIPSTTYYWSIAFFVIFYLRDILQMIWLFFRDEPCKRTHSYIFKRDTYGL